MERERRRTAEDEVAHLNKSAMQMNKIIEEYRMVIEQSQKSKHRLKKNGPMMKQRQLTVEAGSGHHGSYR